jgi:hypothetical protein
VLRVLSLDGSRAAIRREDAVGIVDLATDSFVTMSFTSKTAPRVWFAAGGNVLLVQQERDVHAFDALSGNPLWQRPSATLVINLHDLGSVEASTFVSVAPVVGFFVQPARNGIRLVNVLTGLEPEWMAQFTPIRTALASPCGRYVLVGQSSREGAMHDAKTGAVLWRTKGALAPLAVESVWFSDDGEELKGTLWTAGPKMTEARWKAATGEVLQAPPKGALPHGHRNDTTPRYRLGHTRPGTLQQWIDRAFAMLGTPKSREKIFALFDVQRDRSLGLINASMDEYPDRYPSSWVSGEDRILVRMRRYLNYYSIPPQRDWAKLALWCIVPTVAVAFVLAVVQQVRSQRKPLAAGPREAAQTSATL